jgi:hypothetical protein
MGPRGNKRPRRWFGAGILVGPNSTSVVGTISMRWDNFYAAVSSAMDGRTMKNLNPQSGEVRRLLLRTLSPSSHSSLSASDFKAAARFLFCALSSAVPPFRLLRHSDAASDRSCFDFFDMSTSPKKTS